MGKDFNYPELLEHVTSKGSTRAGLPNVQCNHCKHSFDGSNTRVANHFHAGGGGVKKCKLLPASVLAYINRVKGRLGEVPQHHVCSNNRDHTKDTARNTRSTLVAEAVATSQALPTPYSPATRTAGSLVTGTCVQTARGGDIREAFADVRAKALGMAQVGCVVGLGLPNRVVESPLWRGMINAAKGVRPSYKGITRKLVAGQGLFRLKASVTEELQGVRDSWQTQGCSINVDGWKDPRGEHIYNVMASNNEGAVFLFSPEQEAATPDAQWLGKVIL